jgi:hypothetical protein
MCLPAVGGAPGGRASRCRVADGGIDVGVGNECRHSGLLPICSFFRALGMLDAQGRNARNPFLPLTDREREGICLYRGNPSFRSGTAYLPADRKVCSGTERSGHDD